MHFRKGRQERSKFTFRIGGNILETVSNYKYLGVIFEEKCNFSSHCESISKAAGRALRSVISKIHHLKHFGFRSYKKLYFNCVAPLMDYGASSLGSKAYQTIDNMQNRAMRYFLCVHRFALIISLIGDTGWLPSLYTRWVVILPYWNRLLSFDTNRLTRRIFQYDYCTCSNNWCSEGKKIMTTLDLSSNFNYKLPVNIKEVEIMIKSHYGSISGQKW